MAARDEITVQEVDPAGVLDGVVMTPIVPGNDAYYDNPGGWTVLLFENAGGSPEAATIASVPCSHDRYADIPLSVPAASNGVPGKSFVNILPTAGFNQKGSDQVYINTAASDLSVAVLKLA